MPSISEIDEEHIVQVARYDGNQLGPLPARQQAENFVIALANKGTSAADHCGTAPRRASD